MTLKASSLSYWDWKMGMIVWKLKEEGEYPCEETLLQLYRGNDTIVYTPFDNAENELSNSIAMVNASDQTLAAYVRELSPHQICGQDCYDTNNPYVFVCTRKNFVHNAKFDPEAPIDRAELTGLLIGYSQAMMQASMDENIYKLSSQFCETDREILGTVNERMLKKQREENMLG